MLGNVFTKCMQPRIALFTKNPFNILSSEALDLAGICRTLFSTVHFNGLNQSPRRWAKRHQRWWTFVARVRVRVSLVGVSLVRVGLVRVGLVRVSLVSVGLVRVGLVRVGLVRVSLVSVGLVRVGCIQEKTISLQTCQKSLTPCTSETIKILDANRCTALRSLKKNTPRITP